MGGRRRGGGDFGGRLGRQDQVHSVDEEAQVGLGVGGAGEDNLAPVGCGQMDIDHLHGGELCQRASGAEAGSEAMQTAGQGDLQAVGEKGDEDVGFDAPLVAMKDRPDRQVAFEGLKRLLHRDELNVVLPEQRRIAFVRLVRNR